MSKFLKFISRLDLRVGGADETEKRLVFSGLPVFLLSSLVIGLFYSSGSLLPSDAARNRAARQLAGQDNQVYQVLVEQQYSPPPKTKQIRALSNVTAEGTGRLTRQKGFHTLTPHDTFRMEGGKSKGTEGDGKRFRDGPGPFKSGRRGGTGGDNRAMMRIPSNYRFEQATRLGFTVGGPLSIPRVKFEGFRYFQKMLRQIRAKFSPPGANYVYRDQYGTFTQNTIKPQVVKVLFLIDKQGRVLDVRVVSRTVQKIVEQACVESLMGQNFGPPPPAVLKKGNIIGINFIFPPIGFRR